MPIGDPVQPVLYILLGAFLVLASLHLWRVLQRRLARRSADAESKAFTVRLIDQVLSATSNRQWQWDTLTPRETEVAHLVAQGKRNAEIARDLHISIRTVETHLSNIYEKLDVRSRVELARVIRDLVD